jgi:hypothetical protein
MNAKAGDPLSKLNMLSRLELLAVILASTDNAEAARK